MRANRKTFGLLLAAAASLGMTACGAAIPDMTEEQNAVLVEYAAGLLLKYDSNHHGRLVDAEDLEEEINAEPEAPQPEEEAQPEEEPENTATVVDNTQENQEEETVYRSIEEFYGLDGVAVEFSGYEIKNMYPDDNTDELFFAMSASAGCKLVVLHFDVSNVGGQDKDLDMLSLDTKFKISINGETPKYALTTMLTNDLASYKGTITAGGLESLVLVTEVPEETAHSIQTMSLIMRSGTEEALFSLD